MAFRFREQGGYNPILYTYSYHNSNYCGQDESGSFEHPYIETGLYKNITDVVIPDFRRRSERGEIFCNTMWTTSVAKSFTVDAEGEYRRDNVCGVGKHNVTRERVVPPEGAYNTYLPPTYTDVPSLGTLAGTQAKANVMAPDIYALVEIAEAKDTMRMLKRPLDDTFEFIKRVRRSRGFRRYAGSLGGYIADNWLKYRYGLTPLALSIQDAWKLATADRSSRRMTARGFAQATRTWSGNDTSANGPAWKFNRTFETSLHRSVRAGILYEFDFAWVTQSGLSLREIPSAAVELVPYSFVVDWFANLGDYIRAMTPQVGVKTLASWTTTKDILEQQTKGSGVFLLSSPYVETSRPEWTQVLTTTVKHRAPGVQVGLASKVSTIDFETPRDWLHLADGLSLIHKRLLPGSTWDSFSYYSKLDG